MKRCLITLALLLLPLTAMAQEATSVVSPLETLAKQAIIVDAETGDILFEKEADTKMPTSSMSKVMSMFIVFDAIRQGKLSLDSIVTVSDAARSQVGSRMFINAGQKVKVEDLVQGVIVQSGNDASVALAEAVSGTEASFAELMNAKAQELGLKNTHFTNATGLPDPDHYSSARDLATLSIALIKTFPEYYHFYSQKEFTFNGIKQGNRNPLLYRNIDVDGVKTGHTDVAGYGLISSALREGRRIVVVVNGLSSMQERADEPAKLIEWAYREFGMYSFLNPEEAIGEVKIWLGLIPTVKVTPERSVQLCLPRSAKENVKIDYVVNAETPAPITKGQVLGKATLTVPNKPPIEVALLAVEDVGKLALPQALWVKFKRAIGKE
ncbi:MAG: D-alanyl-D-alanine carboxypeptidase [Alphaproteobacteria bacterium]|nr:D-alanyl-D-alanine carboxypeptidase [Alphaproteobacteria bacterium]